MKPFMVRWGDQAVVEVARAVPEARAVLHSAPAVQAALVRLALAQKVSVPEASVLTRKQQLRQPTA